MKFFNPAQWRSCLLLTVLLLFVGLVFSPCLNNQFVNWDDDVQVYENTSIRSLSAENLKEILTSRIGKLRVYIPLTLLSYAIEYYFFEYDPFIYHLNNLILHLLVVALIFVFAQYLGLSTIGAGIAAVIFGIHPLHVESVAWVTERKDVLYAFFYMLSLCCYLKYLKTCDDPSRGSSRWKFYVLVIIFGVLSALAKPMALSLPLILLLLDWFSERKFDKKVWLEKVPIALCVSAIAWVTYTANSRVPGNDILEAMLIWPWTFIFYIRQFVLPTFFVPIYRLPLPVSSANFEYAFSVIIFLIIVFMLSRFKRHRWFLFAVGYYFFSIFFLLRFDASADMNVVADRFMYLPSLGFCILFGYSCQRLLCASEKKFIPPKILLSVALIFLFGIFSVKTYGQCSVWKNGFSLWQHQLSIYPNESVALNNFATILRDEQGFKVVEQKYRWIKKMLHDGVAPERLQDAYPALFGVAIINNLYQKAILNYPLYVDAHYNLGKFYRDIGEYRKALKYYGITIALDPTYKDAYFNLGKIFLELGDARRAKESFEKMISQGPKDESIYVNILMAYREAIKAVGGHQQYADDLKDFFKKYSTVASQHSNKAVTFLNLGLIYREMNDIKRAVEAFEMALELNPRYVEAMFEMANIYDEMKDEDRAISLYNKVISINARFDRAYLNLGVIYSRLQNYSKAKLMFEKVIELSPTSSDAYFNLGFIYEMRGDNKKAIKEYQKAIEFNPNHAKAYYNLGNVYAALGDNAKALESYRKSISINPQYMDPWANLSILSYRMERYEEAVMYCDEARILGYKAPEGYLKALEPHR